MKHYCEECAGDMSLGTAIDPKVERYCRSYAPLNLMLNARSLHLIDVYKCDQCGNSVSLDHYASA